MPQLMVSTGSRPTRGQSVPAATLNGVELSMSSTAVTFSSMTPTFAANPGAQTTVVFTRKPVNLPAINNASDPDMPAVWLTHDAPILYVLANEADSVHAQVLHESQSTTSGFATTNTTHAVLGGSGLGNYIYNYTVDGPVAQFGPYSSNRGAVLLFLP